MTEKIDERFSRQLLCFGKAGQKQISSCRVGIVGLGGIGSLIVQMLSLLGVRHFTLVDDDVVELSNLNRLVGATRKDAQKKRLKVEVAERLIYSFDKTAAVACIGKNLRSNKAIGALSAKTEIIFGCVDNDAARLILTELSAAYHKTLIDSGCQIIQQKDYQEFGGRVIVAVPGDFCLLCAGEIDLEVAQKELESDPEKKYHEHLGYGLGPQVPDPAVISLNTIVAGLAVTEFLMLVTGLRRPNRRVTYRGMRGVFRESLDEKKDTCLICHSLVGKGEKADIKRYLNKGLPKDLPR